MDKFLTKSASNPNLSKRPRDEPSNQQWIFPKRPAIEKTARSRPQISTSNRFSNLTSEQDPNLMSEPFRQAVTPRKRPGNIPPIIIELPPTWTHGKIHDLVTKYNKNFHLHYKGNNKVAVQCYTSVAHEVVKTGLLQEKIAFHTFTRKDEKIFMVVIKGLPESCGETLVDELAELGFKGASITTLKRAADRAVPCPPILVKLPAGTEISKFRLIKYLSNCVVDIQRYKPNFTAVTQCYRCQAFGHGSRNCNLPPRCVKCTESHETKDCPKKDKKRPCTVLQLP